MPLLTKKAFNRQTFTTNSQLNKNSQFKKFKTPLLTKDNINDVLSQNASQNAVAFTTNSQSSLSKEEKIKMSTKDLQLKNRNRSSTKQNLKRIKSNVSVMSVHLSFEDATEKDSEQFSDISFRMNEPKIKEAYFQFVKSLSQSSNKTDNNITSSPISQTQSLPTHETLSQKLSERDLVHTYNKESEGKEDITEIVTEGLNNRKSKNTSKEIKKAKKQKSSTPAGTQKPHHSKKSQKDKEIDEIYSPDSGISLTQEVLNQKEVKASYLEFMKLSLESDKMVPEQNKIKVTQRKRKYMLNSSSDKSLNEPLTIKKNKNGMKKKNRTIKRIVTDEESLISQNENIEKTNQKRKRKYIRSSNAETVKEALVFNKNKHKKNFESRIKRSSLKKIPTDDDSNKNLTLDEKMSLIRESRNVGLYVLCDICNKARYLPHVKDPLDLPDKWYCAMNPDDAHNKCSDPEKADEDEEYLIENLYNAGSVVWAKMDGYPWWPAMVEDDPDVEDYFWLEDNSMKPTWYHVTFFDSEAVTRAWIRPSNLKPFKVNMNNPQFQTPARNKYKSRVNVAFEQACDAIELQLIDRLKKYTFMNRYNKTLKQRESQNNSNNVKNKRKRRDQPGNSLVGRQIASDQNMQPCNTKSTEVATLENGKNSDISMVLNEINWGEAQNISFNLFD